MRRVLTALAVLLLASNAGFAEQSAGDVIIPSPDAVKWGPAPAIFPEGAAIAVLEGDPTKGDFYVLRFKMPAGYRIPAHRHAAPETVTVLSGSFHVGMGDKLDTAKGQLIAPGGFGVVPANMSHYAWTTAETTIQIEGVGPFQMSYVDPADDPSKVK